MSPPSEMLLAAKGIKSEGLLRIAPEAQIDVMGYVQSSAQNLLPDIERDAVEADLVGKADRSWRGSQGAHYLIKRAMASNGLESAALRTEHDSRRHLNCGPILSTGCRHVR